MWHFWGKRVCVCIPVCTWAPSSIESWGKWTEKKQDSSLMQWTWKHPFLLPAAVITIQLSLQLIPLTTDSLWMHALLLEYEHSDNSQLCTASPPHIVLYKTTPASVPFLFFASYKSKYLIWDGGGCLLSVLRCLVTVLILNIYIPSTRHTHSV